MADAELLEARAPLAQLAVRIERETGLHFPPASRGQLASALGRIAAARGFAEDADCVAWLLAGRWDADKAAVCALHLTIGETYFFREPRAFELVCEYARARLRQTGRARPLRLWSAGCCTGEEPYSMAMMLRQAVPELAPAQVSILATDINQHNLDIARAGLYRQWSFRRTSPALLERYFSPQPDQRMLLDGAIRDQVRFAELNLASASYPSAANGTAGLDIIFCRNVLMYFSKRQMKAVIARLHACLVDGGWLVVNPSEASAELFEGFSAVYYPDAVYFQKKAAAMPAPAAKAAPVRPAPARPAIPIERRSPPRTAGATGAPDTSGASGALAAERAYALARAGDIDAALDSLEKALASSPLFAELYQAKALIAIDQGNHQLAMQSLKRLLYLHPDSALAHYLSGVVLAGQGADAAAARHFGASGELLALMDDADLVPGSDGWPVASLRASALAWLETLR